MPKMATKAADNVFYKARIAAASWNDRLGSREGASEVTRIDRTRLANIELGTINPHPEEVLMLSDTYNAPELQNHFCSHLCPLGIGTISPIELEELERVTLQLISAMKSLPEVKDGIIDIAADGVIDAKEKPRMEQYLEVLDEITNKAQTLKLIYRKQPSIVDLKFAWLKINDCTLTRSIIRLTAVHLDCRIDRWDLSAFSYHLCNIRTCVFLFICLKRNRAFLSY